MVLLPLLLFVEVINVNPLNGSENDSDNKLTIILNLNILKFINYN